MKKEELNDFLKSIGYNEYFIEEILSYVDNEKDIDELKQKIEFLNKIGIPENTIDTIFSENPLFLSSTIDEIKNNINFLKTIKLDDFDCILEMNPELISVDSKTMSENYKLLKIIISDKELLKTLRINPEILTFNTDYLEKRLEFFIKNGYKEYINKIILNYFEAFEDEEEEINFEKIKNI